MTASLVTLWKCSANCLASRDCHTQLRASLPKPFILSCCAWIVSNPPPSGFWAGFRFQSVRLKMLQLWRRGMGPTISWSSYCQCVSVSVCVCLSGWAVGSLCCTCSSCVEVSWCGKFGVTLSAPVKQKPCWISSKSWVAPLWPMC